MSFFILRKVWARGKFVTNLSSAQRLLKGTQQLGGITESPLAEHFCKKRGKKWLPRLPSDVNWPAHLANSLWWVSKTAGLLPHSLVPGYCMVQRKQISGRIQQCKPILGSLVLSQLHATYTHQRNSHMGQVVTQSHRSRIQLSFCLDQVHQVWTEDTEAIWSHSASNCAARVEMPRVYTSFPTNPHIWHTTCFTNEIKFPAVLTFIENPLV